LYGKQWQTKRKEDVEMDKVKIGTALSHLVNAVETIKTRDELDMVWKQVASVLRHRQKFFEMSTSMGFEVGDKVQFTGKHGSPMQGTITKKSDKTARVDVEKVVWTVSWSLLRKAA
jgi:hypothetical protein